MAAIWASLQAGELGDISQICGRLEGLPEADVQGDSEVREYYASWAVNIFKYIVAAVETADLPGQILSCIHYAIDLADNIDGAIDPDGSGYGAIARKEMAAQEACYGLLSKTQTASLPIGELVLIGGDVANGYTQAASRVAAAHGWELA